ncbi:ANTAR domain-containing protein [Actinomadura rupiterrae]|uniref:ANTAR domain-containing protein n=1 Tax=Actinomadura rupiterrae TaxID=559627 RepID=UPI00355704F9
MFHAEVHQATGYLSARLAIPPAQAFIRLRSQAVARNVPLNALARAVLSGQVGTDAFTAEPPGR